MPSLLYLTFVPVLTHSILSPYVSSTGWCSAFSFIQNSLFLFSFLYNAFSGVIEDKVKDDLKETVSLRKHNNKRTRTKQFDRLVNRGKLAPLLDSLVIKPGRYSLEGHSRFSILIGQSHKVTLCIIENA